MNSKTILSDDFKFETLGVKERLLLLKILEFNPDCLVCIVCEERTTVEECSILPSILNREASADILCKSILCLSTWMEEIQ